MRRWVFNLIYTSSRNNKYILKNIDNSEGRWVRHYISSQSLGSGACNSSTSDVPQGNIDINIRGIIMVKIFRKIYSSSIYEFLFRVRNIILKIVVQV